ncbi:MAG TPA: Crp/Fnr family transcriptional regulator [Allosphingosinicella sp.]
MSDHDILPGLVRRLGRHGPLDPDDVAAVLELPYTLRTAEPGSHLIREGDEPTHCCFVVDGFVYRHKVTGEGQRQILAIHMNGDLVDLHNIFLDVSDHNVQALTRSNIAFVPRRSVRDLIFSRPNVGRAMWTETLIDASIFREWVLNVGRRPAIARIAHILCEVATRMEQAGLSDGGDYTLPMTQEQLADAAGLTSVHVNRVLQQLGRMGLIERSKRAVHVPDWARLRETADFNARYLHRDEGLRSHARG